MYEGHAMRSQRIAPRAAIASTLDGHADGVREAERILRAPSGRGRAGAVAALRARIAEYERRDGEPDDGADPAYESARLGGLRAVLERECECDEGKP